MRTISKCILLTSASGRLTGHLHHLCPPVKRGCEDATVRCLVYLSLESWFVNNRPLYAGKIGVDSLFQVYPDLVGLGEADSNRMVPTSSESSTFVQRCSGGNLARHTLPPYLASWLSLKVGSIDASTLVDEESTLPSYYYRKPSTDSTIVAVDSSHTRAVWHVMKDWTELVASKVKRFGTSAASFWKSTFC